MAMRCELTGKSPQTGNNVSHAKNRNRRRFLPNLNQVTLLSEILSQKVYLRVSANALRSVEHRGGLDEFLIKESSENLSQKALEIKKRVIKAKLQAAAEQVQVLAQ